MLYLLVCGGPRTMNTHAGDPNILVHCAAIAVARDDFDSAALIDIGEKVGFGAVADSACYGDSEWNAFPLLFFLVHHGIGAVAKRALLTKVRGASSVNICFAPIILFLQDGPASTTLDHIEMGFDDVITLPEDSRVLSARLATQIGQEQIYIETRNYLGPDRRRMEPSGQTHPGRMGQEDYTKLTLLRSPELGVHVLRRQLVVRAR